VSLDKTSVRLYSMSDLLPARVQEPFVENEQRRSAEYWPCPPADGAMASLFSSGGARRSPHGAAVAASPGLGRQRSLAEVFGSTADGDAANGEERLGRGSGGSADFSPEAAAAAAGSSPGSPYVPHSPRWGRA